MKDIISYKTALALKEAGFSQPYPEPGQIWYDLNGKMFICTKVTPGWMAVIMPGDLDTVDRRIGELVFAPSVADMFRELGTGFDLSYDCGEFWCRDEKDWNASEACAAAWLEKNKKQ